MVDKGIIEQYLKAGKRLTVLHNKIPITKNWTKTVISKEVIYAHEGNLGWVLGEDDLVIDVDPKNGGDKSYKELEKVIGKQKATVLTPSKGYHVYLKIPKEAIGSKFRKVINSDYKGIDFLTKNTQCVIPSSKTEKGIYEWHPDNTSQQFNQVEAPPPLITLLKKLPPKQLPPPPVVHRWDRFQIEDMLRHIDPRCNDGMWVKVGMALKDWDSDKGFTIFNQWSKGRRNYDEATMVRRWDSFEKGEITKGTLKYLSEHSNYNRKTTPEVTILKKISKASEVELEAEVLPAIKNSRLSKSLSSNKIVTAIKNRYKKLTGTAPPVSEIRKRILTPEILDETDRPDWCKDWVYVSSHSGFINLKSFALYKKDCFNLENNKLLDEYVPSNMTAVSYVQKHGFVPVANRMMYLPTRESGLCDIGKLKVLNSFNPDTIPKEAIEHTEKGEQAIRHIENHIKFLCGNDDNARILIEWLAHNVQYMGKQILWSPIIQSIEGTGKTFLAELLVTCLGDENVGIVSPEQVRSQYNNWAIGKVVNILQELKVSGHNRHDIVNALKPLITDRKIQVNQKFVSAVDSLNTTNYIAFTNNRDCLPLTETDRRWWIVYSPIQSDNDWFKAFGVNKETYFRALFHRLSCHGAEIRKWMLEYPIREDFFETKTAPMTSSKEAMIATEQASVEGLVEAMELLAKGGDYYNEQVVCSKDFFYDLKLEHDELDFNTTQRSALMKRLGFVQHPKRVIKVDGETKRLWVKDAETSIEEARKAIKEYNELRMLEDSKTYIRLNPPVGNETMI